ncbi:MAG: preprotein translocase subunit YajC [Eubacteriales bacterium]
MNFSMFLSETAQTTNRNSGIITTLIMVAVMGAALYFFMYLPQKKQDKKNNEMKNSLSVGDEVTTIGGIVGRVVSIKEESFVLETTKDRTKIRFLRSALRSIDVKADSGDDDSAAAATDKADSKALPKAELKDAPKVESKDTPDSKEK